MKTLYFTLLFLFITHFGFTQFDIQGHRGARGLYPENSIEAFIYAVKAGATTLEMDVVVSKDGKIVVSHEAYLNSSICLDSLGNSIPSSRERSYNLFAMNYEQIKKCDCGSLFNASFPQQKKISTYKPTLIEVIDSVEQYVSTNKLNPVHYNIEVKSKPATDGMYHPHPDVFIAEIMKVIVKKGVSDRVVIQSFDARVIEVLNKKYPAIKTAYLVAFGSSPIKKIRKLGIQPDVISPYFSLVNKKLMKYAKANQIEVIPWTVNSKKQMQKLIEKDVNGIITDYPNKLVEVLKEVE